MTTKLETQGAIGRNRPKLVGIVVHEIRPGIAAS